MDVIIIGADVIIAIRNSSVDSVVKYWVKPNIETEEKKTRDYFNSNV